MFKNIKLVLFGQFLLFVCMFLINILIGGGALQAIIYFIDLPSLLTILIVLIPGLLIMGSWKDFIKSFSVGSQEYSLIELKKIAKAVEAAQKLTMLGALFTITISIVLMMIKFDVSALGPNLAVCCLSALYAVIIEFLLLPLRVNAERKILEVQ